MIAWLRDRRADDDEAVAVFRYYARDGRLRARRMRVDPETAAELVARGVNVEFPPGSEPPVDPGAFPWRTEELMRAWTEDHWRAQ